jgi:hypothetical protein
MPTGNPGNARLLKDAEQKVTITLPNAANQVNANGLDLGQATPFPTIERVNVRLAYTAATGANNLNINFVVQDSADNTTFANLALLQNPIKVWASLNTVYAAGEVVFKLPQTTRRYLRCYAKGEANGGNASDGTATLELLF